MSVFGLKEKHMSENIAHEDDLEKDILKKKRVLVLFAHPAIHQSRVNKHLINAYKGIDNLHFHDLYEKYPRFFIDEKYEQDLLAEHDLIIFHHPLHWYTCPPIIKHWMDMVLTFGYAFGDGAIELKGKKVLSVVTTGTSEASYSAEGFHGHSIHEFLLPFRKTIEFCGMEYLPPFVIHGTSKLRDLDVIEDKKSYLHLVVEALQHCNESLLSELKKQNYMNSDLSLFMKNN